MVECIKCKKAMDVRLPCVVCYDCKIIGKLVDISPNDAGVYRWFFRYVDKDEKI
jgi:hypothetical protein